MDVDEVVAKAQDLITAKQVFAEPYEKNGVTVIPAAKVQGGGGGGGGEGEMPGGGHGTGSGAGFGVNARPVGVWVVEGDRVDWRPAVDVNRIVAFCFGIAALLALRSIVKAARRPRAGG